ncbi:MAG: hypothetical protein GAK45_01428 [Pseudomonas citronellolis]|nr:MAG: hypothetical protein GAK45_01428 [Pseudomonas citronellolis]
MQQLFGIQAPGSVCAAAVQQDASTAGGQTFGGQQEPRQMAFLAGVAGPVQVHGNILRGQTGAYGIGEAGELFRAFLLVPQEHEEGTELGLFHLLIEDHAKGGAGFLASHAARAALALAENAHVLGERMFFGGV